VSARNETVGKIVGWLFQHPKIKKISYPGHCAHPQHKLAKQHMSGFGGLLKFELDGSEVAALTVLNNP